MGCCTRVDVFKRGLRFTDKGEGALKRPKMYGRNTCKAHRLNTKFTLNVK